MGIFSLLNSVDGLIEWVTKFPLEEEQIELKEKALSTAPNEGHEVDREAEQSEARESSLHVMFRSLIDDYRHKIPGAAEQMLKIIDDNWSSDLDKWNQADFGELTQVTRDDPRFATLSRCLPSATIVNAAAIKTRKSRKVVQVDTQTKAAEHKVKKAAEHKVKKAAANQLRKEAQVLADAIKREGGILKLLDEKPSDIKLLDEKLFDIHVDGARSLPACTCCQMPMGNSNRTDSHILSCWYIEQVLGPTTTFAYPKDVANQIKTNAASFTEAIQCRDCDCIKQAPLERELRNDNTLVTLLSHLAGNPDLKSPIEAQRATNKHMYQFMAVNIFRHMFTHGHIKPQAGWELYNHLRRWILGKPFESTGQFYLYAVPFTASQQVFLSVEFYLNYLKLRPVFHNTSCLTTADELVLYVQPFYFICSANAVQDLESCHVPWDNEPLNLEPLCTPQWLLRVILQLQIERILDEDRLLKDETPTLMDHIDNLKESCKSELGKLSVLAEYFLRFQVEAQDFFQFPLLGLTTFARQFQSSEWQSAHSEVEKCLSKEAICPLALSSPFQLYVSRLEIFYLKYRTKGMEEACENDGQDYWGENRVDAFVLCVVQFQSCKHPFYSSLNPDQYQRLVDSFLDWMEISFIH